MKLNNTQVVFLNTIVTTVVLFLSTFLFSIGLASVVSILYLIVIAIINTCAYCYYEDGDGLTWSEKKNRPSFWASTSMADGVSKFFKLLKGEV